MHPFRVSLGVLVLRDGGRAAGMQTHAHTQTAPGSVTAGLRSQTCDRKATHSCRPAPPCVDALAEVQAAASGCESVAFGQSHRKSSCCVSRQNATASAVSWKAIWKASPSVVTCTRSFSVHGNGSTCNTCKVEPHNRCAWQELA